MTEERALKRDEPFIFQRGDQVEWNRKVKTKRRFNKLFYVIYRRKKNKLHRRFRKQCLINYPLYLNGIIIVYGHCSYFVNALLNKCGFGIVPQVYTFN